MFNKLRNRIVGISMLTTTIVLVVSFSVLYSTVSSQINNRPMPTPNNNMSVVFDNKFNASFSEEVFKHIEADRRESTQNLLNSFITTGICIEILMFLITLYLANQIVRPVKETYEAHKQFIANASHEIKTPLAVIQANIEAADIKGNEWIDNAAKKTEELAELNNQLLTLARIDVNTNEIKKEEIYTSKFINDLIKPLKPQIEKKGINLAINIEKDHKVSINKAGLKQALNILLDNAIKYSDKNITIEQKGSEIKITNDGAIIEKGKLNHIFERFYQTDKTKEGVGLGLAIAKEISNKNNWKLTASSDEKSTSFMLKI